MDQRGRKTFGALAVTHLPGKFPEAPEGLTQEQADMWRAIVATRPCDWFGPDTYPLLTEYIRASCEADRIARELEAFQSEWLRDDQGLQRFARLSKLADGKANVLSQLATKMRLSQQARYNEKAAHTAAKNAGSGAKPWQRQG